MIYVYRPSQSYAGSGVGLDVNVDGKKIGTLKQNGYLYGTVNAGRHVISSRTETTSEVPFDAKVGRSYYIQGAVELGLIMGRPSLVVVPEEQGKLAILGTKYSGD